MNLEFTPPFSLEELRNTAIRAALAVQAIQERGDFTVTQKGKEGPLTEADLLANDILLRELTRLDPDAGWLSEETGDDGKRLRKSRVWIVDPIDGTKEFVNRTPEYAVSIGYTVEGQPRLGAVAIPGERRVIYGGPGSGLFEQSYRLREGALENGEQNLSLEKIGERSGFEARELALGNRKERPPEAGSEAGKFIGAGLLISRSEEKRGKFRSLEGDFHLIPGGSIARKLAILALGEADACVSLYPKSEWDICGGAALLLAAGYSIKALKGFEAHTYNQADTRSFGLVAGSPEFVREFEDYFNQKKLKVEESYH